MLNVIYIKHGHALDIIGHEETALHPVNWVKLTFTVTFEQQAVSGIIPWKAGFHAIQVTGDKDIQVFIVVKIIDEDIVY